MSSEDIKFLKNYVLFSHMDMKYLEEISQLLGRKTFPAGSTIFYEGEKGESVYFLKKGRIKALKSNVDGEEQILEILQAGDVFGEVVLFGIEEYPATTVAMEDVDLLSLSRSKFKEYFYQNPEIGWGMLHEMAIKLRNAQSKIKNLGLRDTRGRVATLLLNIYHRHGDGDNGFTLKLNRQEMASLLGTTRETVSRTLSAFKNEGLIEIAGTRVIIKSLEGGNILTISYRLYQESYYACPSVILLFIFFPGQPCSLFYISWKDGKKKKKRVSIQYSWPALFWV